MRKFVKKLMGFAVVLMAALLVAGCNLLPPSGGDNPDPVEITFTGLLDEYIYNTGDAFSQDILLKDVQIKDQNGKDYKDSVQVNGLNAIPMNDDGTLKQSGTWTVKINVIIDDKPVSTKIIRVVVQFVAEPSDDIIINGDFASGTIDPFKVTNVDGSVATIEVVEEELKLVIDALSWQEAFPRIDYADMISLEEGKFYEVQFSARATVERDMHVQVGELLPASPWFHDQLPVQYYYRLTTEMQDYSFRFAANQTNADLSKLSLLFGLGTMPGDYISEVCDVFLDNVAIIEVDSLGEDTLAPTINAADKSVFVGTEIDINSLFTVTDNMDTEIETTVVIKNEANEEIQAIDTEQAGVYTISITAKDDAGLEASATFTLTVKEKPTTAIPLTNGDEAAAVANGGWIEWHDQGWVGSTVVLHEATVSPTELVYDFTQVGTNWFGNQIFYYDASISGDIHVELDINASAAGLITICGVKQELAVGDNHISIDTAAVPGKATFSIQFGQHSGDDAAPNGAQIDAGRFIVSNLSINDSVVLGAATETPVENGEEAALVASGLPGWLEWHDQDYWCGAKVIVEKATLSSQGLNLVYSTEGGNCWFGMQLFYNDPALTAPSMRMVMDIISSVAGEITVGGTVLQLVEGANHLEFTAAPGSNGATVAIIFGKYDGEAQIKEGSFTITTLAVEGTAIIGKYVAPVEPEYINASGLLNNELHKWVIWAENGPKINGEAVEGKVVLTVNANASTAAHNPQFKQEGLSLEAGKTYKVELVLTSSIDRAINILVQENGGSWGVFGAQLVELSANSEKQISFEFTMGAACPSALFGIMLGKVNDATAPADEHTITIASMSLAEVTGTTPEVPEHTHSACPECGKCTAADCTGEKCEGHEVIPSIEKLGTPVGLVVNKVNEGYIAAFAHVTNATSYKVYVLKGEEVVFEDTIGNGGLINYTEPGSYQVKVQALAEGYEASDLSAPVDWTIAAPEQPGEGGETPEFDLPVDIILNSAVRGAWIYIEVRWTDAADAVTAIAPGSMILNSGKELAYANEVGVAAITENSYKMGAGFASAEFLAEQEHKLTINVTHATYEAEYEISFIGKNEGGVDFKLVNVVKK